MADYGNETSRISDLIRQYRDEPLQDIGDVAEEEKSQDQSKRATDLSEYMDKYKTKMEEGGEEIGGGVLLEGGRKMYGRARTLYKKYQEAKNALTKGKKEFRPREGQRSDPQAENEEPLENPEGFTEDTAPEVGDGSIGKTISEAPKLETIGEEGTLTPEQQQASANDLFSQIENQSQFSEQRTYETRNIEPTSDDSGGGGGGASAETDVSDSTRVFGEGTSTGRVVGNPTGGGGGGGSASAERSIGDDVPEPEGYAPELFSDADSIASRVGGSILDTFKSRGAGLIQKFQDAKNFLSKGASAGGEGASAGTTAGGEALGETAGVIGGEAVGGAVAGGVAEAVVGAVPVLGEIALVGVGLVKFGEAIYHLFHPKHDKAKVINAPQNIAMPTATQQLTTKYAQALPSIDTASDVSASVMSF